MRVLFAAAVATALLALPAVAQTEGAAPATVQSACGEAPPAPTDLPDGATANRRQMENANERFMAWAEHAREVLTCQRAEAEAALAHAQALSTRYNAGAAALTEAVTSWQAQADTFNARGERRN